MAERRRQIPPRSHLNVPFCWEICTSKQLCIGWMFARCECVVRRWLCLCITDLAAGVFTWWWRAGERMQISGRQSSQHGNKTRGLRSAVWHARLRRLQTTTDQPKAALISRHWRHTQHRVKAVEAWHNTRVMFISAHLGIYLVCLRISNEKCGRLKCVARIIEIQV